MRTRTELSVKLREILGSDNVYFQPPSSKKMSYPCIRYELNDIPTGRGDNIHYKTDTFYKVTYIDASPTSNVVKKLMELPDCSFDRFYYADNLNHYVYNIYI